LENINVYIPVERNFVLRKSFLIACANKLIRTKLFQLT